MQTETERERGQYIELAIRYAQEVVAGTIDACKYVRLACQRQLDELCAAERGEFEYRFDIDRGEEICFFVERLPHIRGRWKTANLRLEPWQIFILTAVFGWLDEHGNRIFNKAVKESSQESFIKKKTAVNATLQLRLDVVVSIINIFSCPFYKSII